MDAAVGGVPGWELPCESNPDDPKLSIHWSGFDSRFNTFCFLDSAAWATATAAETAVAAAEKDVDALEAFEVDVAEADGEGGVRPGESGQPRWSSPEMLFKSSLGLRTIKKTLILTD
jgi:hypothetical protein